MRKPRPFVVYGYGLASIATDDGDGGAHYVRLETRAGLEPEEAERLAAWLLKAAEWIREKEGE